MYTQVVVNASSATLIQLLGSSYTVSEVNRLQAACQRYIDERADAKETALLMRRLSECPDQQMNGGGDTSASVAVASGRKRKKRKWHYQAVLRIGLNVFLYCTCFKLFFQRPQRILKQHVKDLWLVTCLCVTLVNKVCINDLNINCVTRIFCYRFNSISPIEILWIFSDKIRIQYGSHSYLQHVSNQQYRCEPYSNDYLLSR